MAHAVGTPLDRAFARNSRPSYPTIDRSRAGIQAPPDYDPGVVLGDDPASASARSALAGLHETWREVGQAARDQSVPSAELGRVAQSAVERALRRADRASEAIARSVVDAERAVEAKVAPAIPDHLASEVRSHWAARLSNRGGKPGKFGELLEAVRADVRTSAAVVTAPAYLSGLTAAELATIRALAVDVHAPEEGAKLKAARRAAELVTRASARLLEEMAPRLRVWSGSKATPLAKLEGLGRE